MNRNRKNRLNLSLVKKSESPKSPVRDNSADATPECITPFNSRKRSSTFSDGSPVMNDYDSPIPMSQDTSNIVTGVSWAWNSPKRTIPEECRPKPRPLLASNNIFPPKEPDLRKKTTGRLVGFYKFQEELKKIQLEASKESQSKKAEVKPPPESPNGTDLFDSFGDMEADSVVAPTVIAAEVQPDSPCLAAIDSFNDSAFDSLLLQASQVAERKSLIVPDAAAGNEGPTPVKRKSFFKSRTINDLDSLAVNDLLNDSVDFCLIEASQLVEGKLNDPDQKTTEPGSSKKISTLTRHKSLPASPSQNNPITRKPDSALRSNYDANPHKSGSSSGSASAHAAAPPKPVRLETREQTRAVEGVPVQCTKEEIEQKRQEALKRFRERRLGLGKPVFNANAAARKP
ncbi:uncharacterized protein LOC119766981 [Culex quinquefasciatus]|uniref:uncharacterized protein LOC119766981 n=1 Tax=Culex quinquefasciatus TaxID=7176 RepID=UPI0018E3F0CD|nr:uncharacterized protein LOC119766981 [Culex quinquefasciatus]